MTTSFRCYFNSLLESYLSGFKNAYALSRWRSWHPLRCAFIVLCLRYHIQFANIFQVDKILHWLNHHFHFTFKLKSYFLQVKTTTWVKRRSRTGLLGTKISQCKKSQKTNIQLSNNIFTNLPLQFSLTIPNPVKKF